MQENEIKFYKLEKEHNERHYEKLQNEMDSAKMVA